MDPVLRCHLEPYLSLLINRENAGMHKPAVRMWRDAAEERGLVVTQVLRGKGAGKWVWIYKGVPYVEPLHETQEQALQDAIQTCFGFVYRGKPIDLVPSLEHTSEDLRVYIKILEGE